MTHPPVLFRRATAADWPQWAALRRQLWPDCGVDPAELRELLDGPDSVVFLAVDPGGEVLGLAEASLRHDYVNGTAGSPVGFLEGWYVQPAARRRGVGGGLVADVARWARGRGCRQLASDTAQDDAAAQSAHAACGFSETERVVYYCMDLEAP